MTKEEAKNILCEWLEPKDNKTVSSDDFSEANISGSESATSMLTSPCFRNGNENNL